MAERVVYRLEVVQIEVMNRERYGASLCCGICLVNPLGESGPVRKPRQPIGAREPCELLFCLFTLRDVDDNPFDFDKQAFLVAHWDIAVLNPAPGAVPRA